MIPFQWVASSILASQHSGRTCILETRIQRSVPSHKVLATSTAAWGSGCLLFTSVQKECGPQNYPCGTRSRAWVFKKCTGSDQRVWQSGCPSRDLWWALWDFLKDSFWAGRRRGVRKCYSCCRYPAGWSSSETEQSCLPSSLVHQLHHHGKKHFLCKL